MRTIAVRAPVRVGAVPWLVLVVLGCATVPVTAAGLTWGPLTRDSAPVLAAALSLATSCYAAVRRRGALRWSWSLLAAMILLNALGAAQWVAEGGSSSHRTLSLPDALYLGALVPGVVGLVIYPTARGLLGTWRPVIVDGVVLASSLLLLGWELVLRQVAASVHGPRAFMLLVYPITDVLIISLVVVLMLRSTGPPRLDVVLLGVSFAGFTVGDVAFALDGAHGHEVGAVAQLGYVGAGLALAAAGLCAASLHAPRRVLQRDLRGLVAPTLPDVAAMAALAVCVARPVAGDLQGVLVATVLTVTTARRVALTWQNLRLRRDLEDRVAARTEELRELTAEHERLDGMKQEFVSAVSHELRTPLTAIHASLELLADGDAGTLPPAALPVVEMAARGSRRLSRLVNDIIDLERLESGTFDIRLERHELQPLVSDAVHSLESLARQTGIVLHVEPTDEWALCDGDRLTQALVNLVGNAVKFTAPGGVVTVSSRRVTGPGLEPKDAPSSPSAGGWLCLSVADTGRGIPAEELAAIFDPFHQVDPDDARQQAGTGLGLAITRRIVETHGGHIRAESEVGRGSVFHLTLPAAPVPHSEVTEESGDTVRDEPAVA